MFLHADKASLNPSVPCERPAAGGSRRADIDPSYRERGGDVAVSLYPAVRGVVRRDAPPVPYPGTPRESQATAGSQRLFGHGCLYEVGFTSLGSFSDLFARRVGSAPSPYR